MTRISLPRVFIIYNFLVVFKFRPSPFLKRHFSLVGCILIYQSVFNNGATDWRFIFTISRTDVLSIQIWTCLRTREGNHKTTAREIWQTKLWLRGLQNHSAVHCSVLHANYYQQTSSPQLPLASTCMNNIEMNPVLPIHTIGIIQPKWITIFMGNQWLMYTNND
jgi:hypothetical protein